MIILSIDYGKRRIGLALKTDEVVSELPQIVWDKKFELFEKLQKIISDYAVEMIVVGIPPHGEMVDEINGFVHELSKLIRVETMDESLSSKQAEYELSEKGLSSKKQRGIADSVAARLVLEEYLSKNAL